MKKSWVGLLLVMILLSGCNKGYSVWNLSKTDEEPAIRSYVKDLQTDLTERRGFKLFNLIEEKKMVVISTGNNEVELEMVDLQITDDETLVTVKEIKAKSEDINPYILVALDQTSGKLKVVNEVGEEYEITF